MNYKYVKCPNFITQDSSTGAMKALQCKLCGVVIADTVDRTVGFERTRGGQLIKVVRRQMTRFGNYCEIKIAFADPNYFHVTHGCRGCMHMGLHPSILAEIHAADQEVSPDGYTAKEKAQTPVGVVALQSDQSGIV